MGNDQCCLSQILKIYSEAREREREKVNGTVDPYFTLVNYDSRVVLTRESPKLRLRNNERKMFYWIDHCT